MPGFSFGFGRRDTDSAQAKLADDPFVPDRDIRRWIDAALSAMQPHVDQLVPRDAQLVEALPPLDARPADLDQLFDVICGVQSVVGQGDVELTLLESGASGPDIPSHFVPLASPKGQLMHTLRGPGEYLMVYSPAMFKKAELMMAAIARQLGLVALDLLTSPQTGNEQQPQSGAGLQLAQRPVALAQSPDSERLALAELVAIRLGLGIWIANGSYIFENACCGGGCGVPLGQLVAGLSMPEACYALASDSLLRGSKRRRVARSLAANQKAAFSKSWKLSDGAPDSPTPALAGGSAPILSQ